MKIYYSDHHVVPLPEGHRFPMSKYAMLRERIAAAEWDTPVELIPAEPATAEQILRVHSLEYFERVSHGCLDEREVRRIGFPWSPELVVRSLHSVGGTVAACRAALREGISVSLAGGTHHAHPAHGGGFCVFNDAAVAARTMQAEEGVQRVAVLDCDVHQGDGTAAIFAADPSVFTFSIHGEKNFPFRKSPGDLDIALPDGADDSLYLAALNEGLERSMEQARPDLAIYIAGADPYEHDRLGRLSLSKEGLAARDEMVLSMCGDIGLPVAVVLGGGYAVQVQDTVDIHFNTIQTAIRLADCFSSEK